MAETTSIRQRALEKIRDNLRAVAEGEPVGDDAATLTFSKVEIGPLGSPDRMKHYTVGVVAGRETKQPLFPMTEPTLRVTVEFLAVANKGEDSYAVAEKVLLQVQRTMEADTTLGGLVVDVEEAWNDLDLETYGDRTVAGAVAYDVKYRHRYKDPRNR